MAATFVVEDGTGKSTANSYLSVAGADSYHENYSASTAWSGSTQAQKEAALRLATQYLDAKYNKKFRGLRVNSDQALCWPRVYADRDDLYGEAYYDYDSLPQPLEDATAELALKVREGDTLLDDISKPGNIASESVTVGPISKSTTYVGGRSQVKSYPLIENLVRPLLNIGTVQRG